MKSLRKEDVRRAVQNLLEPRGWLGFGVASRCFAWPQRLRYGFALSRFCGHGLPHKDTKSIVAKARTERAKKAPGIALPIAESQRGKNASSVLTIRVAQW